MGTFKEETDRIIEVLKETEKGKFFMDDFFVCTQVSLNEPNGFGFKNGFLLGYRETNFLLMEGTAWNTPLLQTDLKNFRQRWELYLVTLFLGYKNAVLKGEEFRKEVSIALRKFREGNFLDYLLENLKEEEDVLEGLEGLVRQSLETERKVYLMLFGYLINKVKVAGIETVSRLLSIPNIYGNYYAFLENLLKDFPEELKELREINEALHITNPEFNPPKEIKIPAIIRASCSSPFLQINHYRTIPLDLVIFLPENWQQEEPTLLQLQMGAILYQRGKLTEEEKNELVYLVTKLGIKVDSFALVTALKGDKERKDRKLNGRILGFKGGATPKGILAYIRKVGNNEKVKDALPQEEGEDWVELPEEKEEWEEVAEKRFYFPIPPNNLYKKPHKWQLPSRNQYATLWEVAGELAVTFPGRMNREEVWRAWLYRQIKVGKLKAFQQEKKYEFSDNISYVTKRYFMTPDEVEKAIKLYKQQEERVKQREKKAELIKELAKAKNVGIRQAQKIAKGKTDEELTKYIEELKGGRNESA